MGWTVDAHELPAVSSDKKIASVPYKDCSYTDRINSFGTGSITLPSDYPRLTEILDPASDEGSLLWVKRDGVATDMAFFARRWSEDVAEDETRLVKLTGPGVGAALLATVVEPYGTGEAYDWIWGGKNILSNPGFEDSRAIPEAYEIWNDASGGSFTLTVDGFTTGSNAWNISATNLEISLEAIASVVNVLIEGDGDENDPWRITFVAPTAPLSEMTLADSVTGGDSTIDRTVEGADDPTPWTKVQNVEFGVPPVIATYASDGWESNETVELSGTYCWRVNGLAAYAGHQQLVRVTPGMTYQIRTPIRTGHTGNEFRTVIRTRMEELIGSTNWPSSTVASANVWDSNTWRITDLVIPDGVTEVIYRFGYVGTGNPDPYTTDDNEMNEGLVATSGGGIMDVLLTAMQLKGSLSWLDWNFTSSLDSNGNAWTETALSFTVQRGKSIGQALAGLAQFGIEYHVFWNGTAWELGLYDMYDKTAFTHGLGTDRSADDSPSVILGKGVESGPININEPVANVVYAEGANGLWSEVSDAASIAIWDRREGYVADFGIEDQDTLDAMAQSQLDERLLITGDKLRLVPPSHEPYDVFDLGDTLQVTLPPRTSKTPRRIVGLVTQLPTASTLSPVWEVDLDMASYGESTAIAEGLRRVFAKFDNQPDMEMYGAGIPFAAGVGSVPTFFVAAKDARPEMQAIADYVCTGVDDQVQINLAIQAMFDMTPAWGEGGIIQLSGGTFYCSDQIYINADASPIWLRGMGKDATMIEDTKDAATTRDGLVETYCSHPHISGLSVVSAYDGYRSAIYASPNSSYAGLIADIATSMGSTTESEIVSAVWVDGDMTLRGVEVEQGNQGDGMRLGGQRILVDGCMVRGATTQGYGNGNGIGTESTGCADVRIIGSYFDNCDTNGIYMAGDNGIIVGNDAQDGITIHSTAAGTVYGLNIGSVSDNGTGSVGTASSPLTTKGDLWGFDTADNRVPIGSTDEDVLTVDSSTALGMKWATPTVGVESESWTLGAVTTITGNKRLYTPVARTIIDVTASVGTASSSGVVTVDVDKDGTTIFTTPANRPEIAASGHVSSSETPDVTSWGSGSYLTVNVDDAGTGAEDLVVTVRYEEA